MKPWENPYFEEDYENPDCDCYGCATMRRTCQYEKRRNKEDDNENEKQPQ